MSTNVENLSHEHQDNAETQVGTGKDVYMEEKSDSAKTSNTDRKTEVLDRQNSQNDTKSHVRSLDSPDYPRRPQKRPTIRNEYCPQRPSNPSRNYAANDSYNRPQNRREKDVADTVRHHYNARPEMGLRNRRFSPIINLKRFNNWIKSVLINKFTPKKDLVLVLDMGCGKGGDLIKWDKVNVDGYVGIDIAEISVNQARRRYQNLDASFDAVFYSGDCFSTPIYKLLPPDQRRFDIVSLQFCMHYAFESEALARQMLENVSSVLPRGGIMVGTIPSSDRISYRASKMAPGTLQFGNAIYHVRFESPPNLSFRPPFGNKYFFYLEDAVSDVPEFVVPFEAFRALAEDYHLEMIWQKSFREIFMEEKNSTEFGPLLERMQVIDKNGNPGINGPEMEAADFYLAFAFEKRGV
ncbi:P-TEFb-cap methyltransferase Pcm1 [Schizosaccharomyces japonicus yFS275]|uniref:mRNA cap guanine-N(7) methyltransferase n=1 Tax=Schizosaccharomyces japonicus (strain yFS275 / FY16936) TaxID=402676 RepID=B6K5Q9_SCHJY|nr:P-TEFb-cap methyltransferase Pcm1 [Schizosaccharomyces japonicus yFS275]EEB08863.1 P-TEFb-cap methyltransferase Pcm1 [Schizosaccharomyces japonicus yFS275]